MPPSPRSKSPYDARQAHKRRQLLEERAQRMRHAPTSTEARLWEAALRGSRLGVAFKRQVVLGGRFIVDFLAPAKQLVVEVDGPYHARRSNADARRDEVLARLGLRVLRIPSELVERDLLAAVALIRQALEGS